MIQQNVTIVNNGIINMLPEHHAIPNHVISHEIKKNDLKDLQPSPKDLKPSPKDLQPSPKDLQPSPKANELNPDLE